MANKTGRPRKPDHEKRSIKITLLLNEAEAERLDRGADTLRRTRSDTARTLLLQALGGLATKQAEIAELQRRIDTIVMNIGLKGN